MHSLPTFSHDFEKSRILNSGADKFGRQRGVLFERDANVRARFNHSEAISKRCRPKCVKLGDEVSTPSAINDVIAIREW